MKVQNQNMLRKLLEKFREGVLNFSLEYIFENHIKFKKLIQFNRYQSIFRTYMRVSLKHIHLRFKLKTLLLVFVVSPQLTVATFLRFFEYFAFFDLQLIV